jgi:integrase
MRRRLTDRLLRSLKPAEYDKRVEIADTIVPGLAIRVTDKGCRTFVLIARFPGGRHWTRRAIGEYGKITLESAREIAREWHALLARGQDPRAERRRTAGTFASTVAAYIAHIAQQRQMRDVQYCLQREFVSRWRDRPIDGIVRRDVIEVIDTIVARGASSAARNALSYLRVFFNWARERGVVESSPCDAIKPGRLIGKKNIRQRTLSDDELRLFWRATGRLGYPFGPLYRLLLLTGTRLNEAAEAHWREFDLAKRVWTIPPARFKSDSTHLVPLTDDMVALLKELPQREGYLFSAASGRKLTSFGRAKARLDQRMTCTAKALARLRGEEFVEIKPWRIHDLRRVVRTHLSQLRVPGEIAELVIGHGRKGIQRTYNLHEALDEMREALELWSRRLHEIVEPPPENVVRLRA